MDAVRENKIRGMHSPTLKLCAVVAAEGCEYEFPHANFLGRLVYIPSEHPIPYRVRNNILLLTIRKIIDLILVVLSLPLIVSAIFLAIAKQGLAKLTFEVLCLVDFCGYHLEPLIQKVMSLASQINRKPPQANPQPPQVVPQQPVVEPQPQVIPEDEKICVICTEEVLPEEKIERPRCDKNCQKKPIHKVCMEQWLSVKPSCPHCRMPNPTREIGERKTFREILGDNLEIWDYIRLSDFTSELRLHSIQFTQKTVNSVGLRVFSIKENPNTKPIDLYLRDDYYVVFCDVSISEVREEARDRRIGRANALHQARQQRRRAEFQQLEDEYQREAQARRGCMNRIFDRFHRVFVAARNWSWIRSS